MMVNNFQHLSVFDVIHRLALFIVIHENQLLFLDSQEITPGNRSLIKAVFVQHRKGPVSGVCHYFLDAFRVIFRFKGNQIFLFHDVAERNTLIDQPRHRKGVVRRADDHASVALGNGSDTGAYSRVDTDNHTSRALFGRPQMVFVTISQKDEIPRFQIGFHFIRMGRSNDYFALAEDSILISYDYFSAYRIGDTAETGLGP